MDSQRCMWNSSNNYDIELKTSNGNNSNRMELRTRGMFLDYRHNENYISDRTGWKIDQWPKGKSCVYFHRHMKYNDKTIEIKIDLFFYDDEGRRKTENSYSFDLFANLKHPHAESKEEALKFAEEDYNFNLGLFSAMIPEYMDLFSRKDNGRLHSNKLYSRNGIKDILKNIMLKITQEVESKKTENS